VSEELLRKAREALDARILDACSDILKHLVACDLTDAERLLVLDTVKFAILTHYVKEELLHRP